MATAFVAHTGSVQLSQQLGAHSVPASDANHNAQKLTCHSSYAKRSSQTSRPLSWHCKLGSAPRSGTPLRDGTYLCSKRSWTGICQAANSEPASTKEAAKPSPGGSVGEDGMSADLRHMREAGPIGDSAAGVAGRVRSAEELEAANETAQEIGSPAKTSLAGDYGPGASAVNPGVDSEGEIDYSKAVVQPGAMSPASIGSSSSKKGPVQETDTSPGAQGYTGQESGSKDEAMAESFEAQAAREPEALANQVGNAAGSGLGDVSPNGANDSEGKKKSEGKTSLVPDEDLVGSKSSGESGERKEQVGSKDLNDAVGPPHQAL